MRKKPRNISVFVDDRDVLAAGLLEQLARFHFSKARIARLDHQEKSVVGRATETFPIENRVIPARQTVHNEQSKEGGEGGKQNRQLKHDREKCRDRAPVERFAMNDERINEPRRTELERHRGDETGNTAAQHRRAQP